MEQARLFLAIVLSLLVFVVWGYFFGGFKEPQKLENQKNNDQIQKEENYQEKEKTPVFENENPTETVVVSRDDAPTNRIPRTIEISTALYKIKISESGAVVNGFVLNNYKESLEKTSKLKELVSQDMHQGTVQTIFDNSAVPGIERAVFVSDAATDNVNVDKNVKTVCFSWKSTNGIKIEKKYTFFPETYLINLSVNVINESDKVFDDSLSISLLNPYTDQKSRMGFEGPCAFINNKLEEIKTKKQNSKKEYEGKIGWIAVQDRYFISSVITKDLLDAKVIVFVNDSMEKTEILTPKQAVKPGNVSSHVFTLYFGPKSVAILKSLGCELDKAVDFGWFDILAKLSLRIMNFLFHYIPNYGIAIIILTLIIKVVLWPLGTKSYKSMNEMKKLQPLMTEIREKYKDDKKKMNEEIMGLYKTYKINPLGGCLPMVAQIPVFIAFYRMLYGAIELRHAPFFGWINDLSAPDRLFHFGFSIPFMQPPYGIPVLTIVMGATMLIQQKMSPPAGDPAQAKIMMLMPIVFTFIFINFSSGLVLYWLVNNVLSIAQQYYIIKKYK